MWRNGRRLSTHQADVAGSAVIRNLEAGSGYVVKVAGAQEQSRWLTVQSIESSKPKPEHYTRQRLSPGFNYITARDGTTLSAWVTLPKGTGPFPTVVNYSGYAASRPGVVLKGFEFLCGEVPVVCNAPEDAATLLAGMMGYATVSVNMRGTGCSGGAYDYFEKLQILDGYDVIETVAAQDWVLHHRVGMVGLSYPGISQLFVAAEQPPSLAAIAPMSVIGSTTTTLLPGGILNNGFALAWVRKVLKRAVPYGQGWEQKRVDDGDEICRDNQLLHNQLVDNFATAKDVAAYEPELHQRYDPVHFVDRIEVPVFLTGAWQDEQTGPYFFLLFNRFTSSPAVRLSVINGVHIDGFAPDILSEWHAFLELFVAKRVPRDPKLFRSFSPFIFQEVFQYRQEMPSTQWSAFETYETARNAWMSAPKITAIFESGAGDRTNVGAPKGTFIQSFSQWPPEGLTPTVLYFQPEGGLAASLPIETQAAVQFFHNPTSGQRGILAPGADVWDKLPQYDWAASEPGKALVFEGGVFANETVLMGSASVDLWLKSPTDDADLQVTLSEIRADGTELYIQSGWLRASHRAVGPEATEVWPAQTLLRQNQEPLPISTWELVRVGTAGFAHVMHARSKLRVTVDTPGGTRADWRFENKAVSAEVAYVIGVESGHASRVVLPVVEHVKAPPAVPPCPSLRGQPCRVATPYLNLKAP